MNDRQVVVVLTVVEDDLGNQMIVETTRRRRAANSMAIRHAPANVDEECKCNDSNKYVGVTVQTTSA